MNYLTLILVISDRTIDPTSAYAVFIALGAFGLLLGFWRRWLSAMWLILVLACAVLQIDEVKWMYSYISDYPDLLSFLRSDLAQLHFAVFLGLGLNIAGLFIKKTKTRLP